jgi:hypothetical protein
VDGLWRYTLSRDEILRAMVTMLQTLLDRLDEGGLLSADSPVIEVENAGWGLEYGMQTAEDFTFLFDQLNDRHGKVRVAWDLNHLLHAVGADTAAGRACFFLPGDEVSPDMKALEERLGDQPEQFAQAWIERNLLHPATACRTGCVHLSDCVMKETEFFRRGRLIEPYASELDALPDVDAKEQYGVRFVLTYYDSHVPLGSGILTGRAIAGLLDALAAANPGFSLLHELKNARDLPSVLDMQLKSLCQTEKQPSA